MLKLLGKASSINVRKVLWTCDELGLGFEHEAWGSGFRSTQEPEFLALNPMGLVPVLLDGALVLRESNTICRYLAVRYGHGRLLPADPAERARVEQWMDWQATELNNAWRPAFMALVRGSAVPAEAVAASVAEWNLLMQLLNAQLQATGAHVTGPELTLADVVLGLSAHRWRMAPMPRPTLPALEAWLARLDQRPAFRRHGNSGTP